MLFTEFSQAYVNHKTLFSANKKTLSNPEKNTSLLMQKTHTHIYCTHIRGQNPDICSRLLGRGYKTENGCWVARHALPYMQSALWKPGAGRDSVSPNYCGYTQLPSVSLLHTISLHLRQESHSTVLYPILYPALFRWHISKRGDLKRTLRCVIWTGGEWTCVHYAK